VSQKKRRVHKYFFFFLVVTFPLSPPGLSGTLRSACFFLSSFFLMCGGAPGYFPRPLTPTLSSPFSFLDSITRIQTQHPWEAHPAWDLNPVDLAVVSEECRSSFHHPTVSPSTRHTHTSMARRRFLPWKKSSPFGEIRTH
jgi:hypothetical protein